MPQQRPLIPRLFLPALPFLALLFTLGGCAASGTGDFTVPRGQYAPAFNAARDVLHDHQFRLERVDSAAGVITTAEKASAGLATPWNSEHSSLDQDITDMLNQQRRSVRITFDPTPATPATATTTPSSTDPDTERAAQVRVTIWRIQSPLVRPNSKSVKLTTSATDPMLSAQQIWAQYEVPLERDEALEASLAREIQARLRARPAPTPP